MRQTRRGEGARVVAVNLALIIVGCVGLELVFGEWFSDFVPPHGAIVNRTFQYNQTLYQPHGLVTYSRDRYGLRSAGPRMDRVEMVSVGGSTTDQRYVTDGATWQDAMFGSSNMYVANAGVDGLSSTGHVFAVRNWLHHIPDLRPRAYVHYIGINDALYLLGVSKNDPSLEGRLRSLRERQNEKPALDVRLRYRSALYRSYLRITAWIAGPPVIFNSPASTAKLVPAELDRTFIRAYIDGVYVPNLLQLLSLHRQRGETVIMVAQPAHPLLFKREGDVVLKADDSSGVWEVALAMLNDATEKLCRENAQICAFIDVAKRLSFEPADFYDFIHNTPAGAKRLGEFLAGEGAVQSGFVSLEGRAGGE